MSISTNIPLRTNQICKKASNTNVDETDGLVSIKVRCDSNMVFGRGLRKMTNFGMIIKDKTSDNELYD